MNWYKNGLKRVLDFTLSFIFLVILMPLIILISFLVYLTAGSPVFYKQERIGLAGRKFTLFKFRTMSPIDDNQFDPNKDHLRIFPFGKFLRKYSIDELPQLLNVLIGDMSFVGPRPLLEQHQKVLSSLHRHRNLIRPGLTGLAQVQGRRLLKFSERFDLDVMYCEMLSFWFDIKIVNKTLLLVMNSGEADQERIEDVDDLGVFVQNLSQTRWEVGSFFSYTKSTDVLNNWLPRDAQLINSGRQAIVEVFKQGSAEMGWKRLLLPEFFCPDTTAFIQNQIPTQQYEDYPHNVTAPVLSQGDAVLAVAYFGILPTWLAQIDSSRLILDISHDPLIDVHIKPMFSVASLRKTLPIPDGAVYWSKKPRPALPLSPITGEHVNNALRAMHLKADYLRGNPIDKRVFLDNYRNLEQSMSHNFLSLPHPHSKEIILKSPIRLWRKVRIDNINTVSSQIGMLDGIEILPSTFGLIMRVFDYRRREALIDFLKSENIYPAVLWSLPSNRFKPTMEWSKTVLHIHTDFRYSESDMMRVATIIRKGLDVCK